MNQCLCKPVEKYIKLLTVKCGIAMLFMPAFITRLLILKLEQNNRGSKRKIILIRVKIRKILFRTAVISIKTITAGERDWVQL